MTVARTKLVAPPLPPEAAWADGLVAGLAARATTARMTLLRANGGAGKTTLARALVETGERPWGWCTLDQRDDLASTTELLAAALAAADPAIGDELADLPATTGPDAVHAVAVALTNAVVDAESDGVVVVVDDAHEPREPAVHALLGAVVAAAPASLHLVVTTRTDLPGLGHARDVALGTVVAVDTEVLRVDREVAGRILDRLGWQGSDADLVGLVERCGGWVLGLRLLADLDPEIAAGGDLVRAYLEEEVLAARDDADADALERLAVLSDVTVDAVRAFRPGVRPRRWLGALVRDIPLLATQVDQDTVRLHDLLRDALQRRLADDEPRRADAHRTAAGVALTWQEQVDHLLAAGDHRAAAHLLHVTARDAFPRPLPLAQVAERAGQLPEDVQGHNPWLRVVRATVLAQRAVSREALAALTAAWEELDDEELLPRWSAARHAMQIDTDMATWAQRLATLESHPTFAYLPAPVRTDHHIALAHAMFFVGRSEDATTHRDDAFAAARTSRDPAAVEVLAQHCSPFVAQLPGGVDAIAAWADWCEQELRDPTPVMRLGIHLHRAGVAFYRGDQDRVIAEVAAASPLAERHLLAWVRPMLDWVLASTWFARGDLAPAAALLEDRRAQPGPGAAGWHASLARVLAAQHDTAGLAALTAPDPTAAAASLRGLLAAAGAVVRAEQARAADDPAAALAALDTYLTAPHRPAIVPHVGRVELDRVVALHQAGRRDEALRLLLDELALLQRLDMLGVAAANGAALRPTLERAVDGGFELAAARAVLALTDPPQRPASVAVGGAEQLSPREVEVLRLLAVGHSNREIAEELVISINTVKTHVRNVLGKLGVGSRAAAAAHATRLGIGSP